MPIGILLEVLLAAATSAIVLLVTWPWRERGWPVPIALGLGCAASHAASKGVPAPWPVDATRLHFHFALLGAVLGTVEAAVRLPPAARWAGRAVVAAACAWAMFHTVDPPWRIAAVAASVLVLWGALEWRAPRAERYSMPAVLVTVAGAGAVALERAQSAWLGQMAGALAAAAGPLLVYALLRPRLTMARGGVTAFVLAALPLWALGARFAGLPLESAALLGVAPLAAQRRWWLGVLVAAAAAGFAVYLSHAANLPAADDPYAGYG